jgi:hypothetical protein
MAEKKRAAKSRAGSTRVRKGTKRQTKTKAKVEARSLKLPSSFKLVGQVFHIFKAYWRPLLGIVVVYLILNILFASGLSSLSSGVNDIKANLQASAGSMHPLAKGLSGFGALVGSAGVSGSASGTILQSVLFVVESLVIIWALRQLLAGRKVGVKQAYYSAMYPLVPFVLIICVIFLELIPLALGTTVLNAVLTSAVSVVTLATWIGWLIFILLAGASFYLISSSLFGLYIVTLPDMQPREALRSARNLVRYRRWQVLPKVLFLPVFILAAMAVIIIPLIIWASFLVAPVFYFLEMLTILFVHAYLYCLYRGLIA